MISKDEIEKLYIKQKLTPKEISKIKNCHYRTVLKYIKKYGYKTFNLIEDQITKSKRPQKEVLQNLLDQNNTLKQISQIFNVTLGTVQLWKKQLGVTSKFDTYRFSHLREIPLTKRQKEIITGTVLGDACITLKSKNSARLLVSHCDKQKEYLLWKYKELNPFITCNPRFSEKLTVNNYVSKMWSINTITHPDIKNIYDMFYFNGVKKVTVNIKNFSKLSLAVLYMDDGSKTTDNASVLSTEGFGKEGNEILSSLIKTRFNIESKVRFYNRRNKDYFHLSINRKNSKKLFNIIYPYLLDSMKYKILIDDIV